MFPFCKEADLSEEFVSYYQKISKQQLQRLVNCSYPELKFILSASRVCHYQIPIYHSVSAMVVAKADSQPQTLPLGNIKSKTLLATPSGSSLRQGSARNQAGKRSLASNLINGNSTHLYKARV